MKSLHMLERARTGVLLLAASATALLVLIPLSTPSSDDQSPVFQARWWDKLAEELRTVPYDQFLLPKTVWVKVLTEALAVLAVAAMALGGAFRLRPRLLNLALALFVAWKALSWFWAGSRSLAADNIRWWAILLLWALLLEDWLGRDRARLVKLAWALTLAALALAFWVLLQDFAIAFHGRWMRALADWPPGLRDPLRWTITRLTGQGLLVAKLPDWRGYLWAGMGNTNHIADFLALLFPMVAMQYLLARRTGARLLALAALAASAAALIALYSVGSNGGLILAGLAMLALLILHEERRFWCERAPRLVLLAALFAGIAAFYVLPHALNPHPGGIFRQAFGSERWQAGWPTRVAIWLTSWEIVRQHPVLGIGAGNFTYGYTAVLSPRVLADPELAVYAGSYTNAAHNEPLQALVETGPVGYLLLCALWALILWACARRLGRLDDALERRIRIVVFAMTIAFIGHSLMNFTLQLPTSSLAFVSLAAVAATFGRRAEFPLTVRSEYPLVEIDLETTGMRRIESIGLRLRGSALFRGAVMAGAVLAGVMAAAGSVRPLIADALFNQAKQAQARWNLPAAEDFARRALALEDDHHTARKLLGRLLLETGRYAEARDALERVRERETVFDFYWELGEAYWQLGRRDQAGLMWETYFRRRPRLRVEEPQQFAVFARRFPERAAQLK